MSNDRNLILVAKSTLHNLRCKDCEERIERHETRLCHAKRRGRLVDFKYAPTISPQILN